METERIVTCMADNLVELVDFRHEKSCDLVTPGHWQKICGQNIGKFLYWTPLLKQDFHILTIFHRLQLYCGKCGSNWNVECIIKSVQCILWNAKCGKQNVEYRMWNNNAFPTKQSQIPDNSSYQFMSKIPHFCIKFWGSNNGVMEKLKILSCLNIGSHRSDHSNIEYSY